MLIDKQLIFLKNFLYLLVIAIFLMAVIANPPLYNVFTTEIAPHDNGVNFHGFTIKSIFFLVFNYSVTALLGYGIARNIMAEVKAQLITKVFSSFFLGYLAICGLSRILSFIFIWKALYIVITAVALISAYTLIKVNNPSLKLYKTSNNKKLFLINIGIILTGLFFVLAALMIQVIQGAFIWVGHGTEQYAAALPYWASIKLKHFPIILQHYDELAYHYWATYFYIKKFNPIIPWWITLALIKLSTFSFVFIAFKKLKLPFLFSLIGATFLMLGTSSPLFNKYYMIFDSSNPLFFTVHSGREIGIVVALFIMFSFLKNDHKTSDILGLSLIAIGISTTSLSNTLWAIVIAGLTVFLKKNNIILYLQDNANILLKTSFATVVLLLLMYPLFPIYETPLNPLHVYIRLGLCLLYLSFCIFLLRKHIKHIQLNFYLDIQSKKVFLFIALAVFGISILGNIPSAIIYDHSSKLKEFLHSLGIVVGMIGLPEREILDHTLTWKTLIADHREITNQWYNWYCISTYAFAAYHGVLLIAMIVTSFSFSLWKTQNLILGKNDKIISFIYLFCIMSLPILFFFMDYIGLGSRAWVKSRFLEIAYYLIIFFSFYFLAKKSSPLARAFLAMICIIYISMPFILTERPYHIMRNGQFLLNMSANPVH